MTPLFSTQTRPFKSAYCPPYLWFCHSCSRFSHVASLPSFSSGCFWTKSKMALKRREVFALYSCNRPFPKNVLFGRSHQFEQNSSYCKASFRGKDTNFGPYYYCSTSDPMLERHPKKWGGSTLPATDIPYCVSQNSNSKSYWLQEGAKMKKSKMDMVQSDPDLSICLKKRNERSTQTKYKGMQDGISCENEDFHGNHRQQNALKYSLSQAYMDNFQNHVPPRETTHQKQACDRKNDGMSLVSNSEDVVAPPDVGHQGKSQKTTKIMQSSAVDLLKSKHPLSKQHLDHAVLLNGISKTKMPFSRNLVLENNVTMTNANDTSATRQEDVGDDDFENIKEYNAEAVPSKEAVVDDQVLLHERLCRIYDNVLVVDNVSMAREVVGLLTNQYRHLIHACDTEVAKIDVKQETPVDHGEIICFSIYSGPETNFGNGKSCVWVDVLDGGGQSLLAEFAPFFEDSSIKKVWHNYSFDNHVIENYGVKVCGFHADTMHMARLWDSSRRTNGGYSLEALTCDQKVMSDAPLYPDEELIGKVSMKTIFGRRKVKKDGSEGKVFIVPSVEELQKVERKLWICYSSLDSISTLKLYQNLKCKLSQKDWKLRGVRKGTLFHFYENYWRPFGQLLVKMESEGMLVDRAYLAEIEEVAKVEQQLAAKRFRNWASAYCPDAEHMNVGSDTQLRQLFFGGTLNRKDQNEHLPMEKKFKIPNIDKVIEGGRKAPLKHRTITLHSIGFVIKTDIYTASGWPSVSGDALMTLAGKVSAEYDFKEQTEISNDEPPNENKRGFYDHRDTSAYGTAYDAFGGGEKGIQACHAIAALCEVCSINSLISNFILPLQGNHVSGKNGRIHCSLNINTETGRLSARRPNLQNQPALEKDRYKIRKAFIAAPGNSLIVADYGQLELRILAHLADCKSMLDAFIAGGDFHSRTAMNMYPHIRDAVEERSVLLEWHPQPGEDKPPVPLLKDAFASERRRAKMLNFSIAYGKTKVGLARDWKVSVAEAEETVNLWYSDRQEVLKWQEERKKEARKDGCVHTLLGRARQFPSIDHASPAQRGHIERAAINAPVQGSAADVAMCAMLEISKNARLKELGWRLVLQVHDEVILEGPTESAEVAKAIVVECMSKPFDGRNILSVDLSVDAKCAENWYAAK